MIRIALVDDHSLFRQGLKMLLASHKEFEVVAEGAHEISVVVDSLYGVDMIDLEVSVDAGKIDVAHVHEWVKGETVEPWCNTKGYTVYTCSCGESEKRDWVDALDHDWMHNTCTEPRHCLRCGLTDERYPATGHSWYPATCTDPMMCRWCDATMGTPIDHNWVEADCWMGEHCDMCYMEISDPLGHILEGEIIVP